MVISRKSMVLDLPCVCAYALWYLKLTFLAHCRVMCYWKCVCFREFCDCDWLWFYLPVFMQDLNCFFIQDQFFYDMKEAGGKKRQSDKSTDRQQKKHKCMYLPAVFSIGTPVQ